MTVPPSGQTMHPAWSAIEDGVTWATMGSTLGPAGSGAIRLMVERLPDGVWAWTAWQARRPEDFKFGCVSTREAACAAAEGVAAQLVTIGHAPPMRLDENARRAASG